jgi:Calcineurin-like phosphoesterase
MAHQFTMRACTALALLALALNSWSAQTNQESSPGFSFIVAGDMRNYTAPLPGGKRQFDGAAEAIKRVGEGEFLILPGDFDPPSPVRATLNRYLGSNYFSYFVVGDHEARTPESMAWLQQWSQKDIPHLARRGPDGAGGTIYSFDFGNSHFAIINPYFDGTANTSAKPDVSDATIAWLKQDLAATHQPLLWVACHKPIECLPDMDNGRVRHTGDSLIIDPQRREAFVATLKQFHVKALLCGHTHNCSIAKAQGIWQADSGHARGAGDPGTPSSFLKIRVLGDRAWVDAYRANSNGDNYLLRKSVELN